METSKAEEYKYIPLLWLISGLFKPYLHDLGSNGKLSESIILPFLSWEMLFFCFYQKAHSFNAWKGSTTMAEAMQIYAEWH